MTTFTSQKLAEYFRLTTPTNGICTQQFGENQVPFYKQWNWLGHNGLDFSGDKKPIYACFDGVVSKVRITESRGDAWWISIQSDQEETIDGQKVKLQASFVHIDSTTFKVGDRVKKGETIAISNNTGYPNCSTAPHLHFQINPLYWTGLGWNDDKLNGYDGAVDPQPMLKEFIPDPLVFEGLVVKSKDNPKCYLIEKGKKRWFPSQGAFWLSNRTFYEVNTIQPFEMAVYSDGENMPDLSERVKLEMSKLYPNLLK